jgi:aquaporin Z
MWQALRQHWPEYLIEAGALGIFMVSACVFSILLFHPASATVRAVPAVMPRMLLMGLAMGATLVGIVYSPFGKRSGAHMNPAVTITFLSLGKVAAWDAVFYIAAQFAGGIAGVLLVAWFLKAPLAAPSVNYAATLPGMWGPRAAWLGEFGISFLQMTMILNVSNTRWLNRWTGLFAGSLVAAYIALESPVSGMSMNPARTLGSAYVGQVWTALWIYFTAPLLAMLFAAVVYRRTKGIEAVLCAKLHHENSQRCIFRCRYGTSDAGA